MTQEDKIFVLILMDNTCVQATVVAAWRVFPNPVQFSEPKAKAMACRQSMQNGGCMCTPDRQNRLAGHSKQEKLQAKQQHRDITNPQRSYAKVSSKDRGGIARDSLWGLSFPLKRAHLRVQGVIF